MPVADPQAGRCFVWLAAAFLTMSLASGGVLLALYIYIPGPSSYLYAGMSLVCLPWMFWIILCVYRCCSRCFGFRIVLGGGDGGGGGGPSGGGGDKGIGAASSRRSMSSFGATANRLESSKQNSSGMSRGTSSASGRHAPAGVDGGGGDNSNGGRNNGVSRSTSAASSVGNTSYRSYESDTPLASAMAK